MKQLRHIVSVLMIVLVTVLAAGTIVEKLHGADFANSHVYGTWWFVVLWAAFLVVAAILTFRDNNWKKPVVMTLFLATTCILLGALLTKTTGLHGRMKLEPNRPNSQFYIEENGEITKVALPFSLVLDHFEIETYPDSPKPKDYISHLQIQDGNTSTETIISMNNILKRDGYRFYQSDYDEKGNSILDVAHDPWGITVTYVGYVLLFVGLIAMLIERRKKIWGITVAWLSVLVILMVVLHVRMLTHQLMPVLRSPLFSIHISTIVTAYALLLGIAIVGIIAIIMRIAKPSNLERLERLKDISTAMLYPAVALLAMGIFIGAVWANISWGNYWSWDPKEVWALITLFIYTLPLIPNVLKSFQKPMFFHIYGIFAFLSVVITYFGVNLILGGVHAYN
ncbi:MAG: cytochrome c biogenesis protein CcsA [Bacteroidales bacterium]|nr:cytochrome c biogenesis protein CcsA [Bacteroidales bacterium]